tara:strand:- start:575 stop:916 length:342 start_codon:yes stop_codon:yes gene_type:complete
VEHFETRSHSSGFETLLLMVLSRRVDHHAGGGMRQVIVVRESDGLSEVEPPSVSTTDPLIRIYNDGYRVSFSQINAQGDSGTGSGVGRRDRVLLRVGLGAVSLFSHTQATTTN